MTFALLSQAAAPRWRPFALAALFLAALAAFWPGQASIPASDRDEARFVQASKQMLASGDWVDIRFLDAPRHKKPAGVYWLQAAAGALGGGPDAPMAWWRAPSWIGAAAAAPLTAWAVAPLIGWPGGLIAGAGLAASVLLGVEARIAKTDAALLAVTLVALGALARVALTQAGRWTARLFWAALGAGALLKGPIILIPVAGAAAGVAWAGGPARLRCLRPLEGVAIALAVAAPWYVAITLVTDGAFWAASLGEDLAAKVAGGQEAHGAPPGYHTLVVWGAFWPLAVLAPLALWRAWADRAAPPTAFLLGWLALTWAVFELTPTKLPHYVLPAYPALAALIAATVLLPQAPPRVPDWLRRLAVFGFAAPALAVSVGAVAAAPVIEGRVAWGAVGLAALAAPALWAAGAALWRWRLRRFAAFACVGAVLVQAAVFGAAIPALRTGFVAPRLAEATPAACRAAAPVALSGYSEPSAAVAFGGALRFLPGQAAARALADGAVSAAWVEARDRAAFDAVGAATVEGPAVAGFNYSNGRAVALRLLAAPDGCLQ